MPMPVAAVAAACALAAGGCLGSGSGPGAAAREPAAQAPAVARGEPPAPAPAEEIVAYRESGAWERDTTAVVGAARRFLDAQLARGVRNPAMVLDVDDTSLSKYECLRAVEFVYARSAGCAAAAELPPVPQTLELYRHARAQGVTVFFITGRRERLRRATRANLRAAGYAGPLRLTLRPDRERPGTHDAYKVRARRAIERRGYRILVNVGDQHSDLRGGYAVRDYKVPNPMYVTR